MSSRISIGHPLESTRHLIELFYWPSSLVETGRPLEQKIWWNIKSYHNVHMYSIVDIVSQSKQGFKLSTTLFVSTKMSLCLKKQAELVNCKMLWVERRAT